MRLSIRPFSFIKGHGFLEIAAVFNELSLSLEFAFINGALIKCTILEDVDALTAGGLFQF